MKVIRPPEVVSKLDSVPEIFLAGSIEMGQAKDWQTQIANSLDKFPILIFNPRRLDWDSSWEQSITNPKFKEQVNWELDMQDRASIIAMYFDPATKSPISLLELGLFANTHKLIVCCPEGFWRKGNVDIICERYKLEQAANLDDLANRIEQRLLSRLLA